MVNDDKPFLQIHPDGVTMYGSPWSGKHGLDANLAVPLKGICILERGLENEIAPLSPAEALPRLFHESYQPMDPGRQAQFEELVTRLSQAVPLWKMQCNKEPRAACVCYEAMSRG